MKNQLDLIVYRKEITSLTMNSFENALAHLDELLPPRLATIQNYCQSMELLELDRVAEVRLIFFFDFRFSFVLIRFEIFSKSIPNVFTKLII